MLFPNQKYLLSAALLSYSLCAYSSTQLEPMTVTASRVNDGIVTLSTATLDQTTIEKINPQNTVELLDNLPGVHIEQSGGKAGLSYVSIRGGESNFTLILIDGVPVNDPTNSRGGGFDFNLINPDIIESVEVYRGGISAVYGGEALGGVIHIHTKKAKNKGISIGVQGNIDDDTNHNTEAHLGFRNEQNSGFISISHEDFEYDANKEQLDREQLLGNWQFTGSQSVWDNTIFYSAVDSDYYPEDSGGARLAVNPKTESKDAEQLILTSNASYFFQDNLKGNLLVSWSRHKEELDNPGIAPGVLNGTPPYTSDTTFKRINLDSSISYQTNTYSWVNGASYNESEGSSKSIIDFGMPVPADFKLTQQVASIYTEFQHRPTTNLNYNIGVRFDKPDNFKHEYSFRLASSYTVSPNFELFASTNEGYKLPSFFALANPLVGNPNLRPERSVNSELGFNFQPYSQLDVTLTGFYNRFKDLVDFDSNTFTSVNRSRVISHGGELEMQWSATAYNAFALASTYTDTDVKNNDGILRRRPTWIHKLTSFNEIRDDIDLTIQAKYIGNYRDSSIATGFREIGDYTILSASLAYEPINNLKITSKIANALDEDYEESIGFYGKDLTLVVGLKYEYF